MMQSVLMLVMVVVCSVRSQKCGNIPVLSMEKFEEVRRKQLPETPPLATSTSHLARLAQDEAAAALQLRSMARVLINTHNAIAKYLESWEELARGGAISDSFVHHPLNALALTRHVAVEWPQLLPAIKSLNTLTPHIEWASNRKVASEDDLNTVAAGVARLHDYYTLNLTALAHNTLTSNINTHPITSHIKATASDFHFIGTRATKFNIWNSGVDFLAAALTLAQDNTTSQHHHHTYHHNHNHTDPYQLAVSLKKASKMHDEVLERKGRRSKIHSAHSVPRDPSLARKKKYRRGREEFVIGRRGTTQQGLEQSVDLCRGKDFRSMDVRSSLYCRYVANRSPLYIIGPLRMEVVSLSPYVVVLHGVVTENEAADLRNTSASLLETSATIRHNGAKEVSNMRSSSTAWLYEHNSPHIPRLSKRIESLTGTSNEQHLTSEPYQAVNYGVGGYYTVHHDAVPRLFLTEQRFATFLIYLTDVQQGGLTVFPWLGVGVAPRRGQALLWYNVDRAGIRNILMEHAACPVLLGDKWVINKWLQYGNQAFKVPCLTDPQATIDIPLI